MLNFLFKNTVLKMMLAYKIRAVQVSSEINLLKEVFIVN